MARKWFPAISSYLFPALVLTVVFINPVIARRILRVGYDRYTRLTTVAKWASPVVKPLVYQDFQSLGGPGKDPAFPRVISEAFNVPEQTIHALPANDAPLISRDWIAEASSYPPACGQMFPRNYSTPHGFSFGYLDNQGQYKQITYIEAEANSTPSFFVNTPRIGDGGDYYVKYAYYLENVQSPHGLGPRIIKSDWSSWAGGSYDGFEEMFLVLMLSVAQTVAVFAFWLKMSMRQAAIDKARS